MDAVEPLLRLEKTAKPHAWSLLIGSAVAGGMLIWGFAELRAERAQVDERHDKAIVQERAADTKLLEVERRALQLDVREATIAQRERLLADRETALDQQQAAVVAQRKEVGIEAQEKALRDEARRLVAEYTVLMGKPETYRDRCTKQAAESAGSPLLNRIRTIGEQLRDGGDLVSFANQQGSGFWSSSCERGGAMMHTVSEDRSETAAQR